jgi:hypothetical protein
MPVQELKILTHLAKDNALELHAASMPPKMPSSPSIITTKCSATGNAPPPQVTLDPILPPGQIKSSLKTGKFHTVIASTPPPRQTDSTGADLDNKEDDSGIYSKTTDGVGDGTHLVTVSFIKTNDKIQDQSLPDLTISLDVMPITFVILGLRPCSQMQYGLYGHRPSSPRGF